MDYVFQNTLDQAELERLRAIESIFDPASRRRIGSVGLRPGARCLEVGAGAGSVLRWLSEQVGPSGEVVGVDINTRFLDNPPANAKVVAGDVRSTLFQPGSFDVIHARYVLVHIPEYKQVLDVLWKALKPGGALVIEEPDFTVFRGLSGKDVQAFNNVHRAIVHMYNAKGVDPAVGSNLPTLFQGMGAKELVVENDSPIVCGGSGIATMMNMSAVALKEKYLATGKVGEEDLSAYGGFTHDPGAWAIYYATVGVAGRK